MILNGYRSAMRDWTEKRAKLNEVLDDDSASNEQQDEAAAAEAAALKELNLSLGGSLHLDGEYDELLADVKALNYVQAARDGKPLAGAEAELQQELKLQAITPGAVLLPLEVLNYACRDRIMLADANTAMTAGDFAANLQPPVLPVFAGSDMAFLGVNTLQVPVGETRVPVITDTNEASIVAKSTVVSATAATIRAVKFNAKEARKSYRYSKLENFNYSRELESTFVATLTAAITKRIDDMAVNGSGASNQPLGLLTAAGRGSGAPSNPSGQTDWAAYQSAFAGEVDGIYANDESTMRVLIGASTYAHMRAALASGTAVDALGALQAKGLRVRASSRIPAIASKRQDAILAKSDVAMRNGYWVGMWSAVEVVVDPYTHSDAGDVEVVCTGYFDCGALAGPADRSTNSTIPGIERLRFQVLA